MSTPFEKVDKIISHTIQLEGGFNDVAGDKGGATNYGITIGSFRQYVGAGATVEQLKSISVNEAKQFYKQYYFYKHNIQEFPEVIWDVLFDMVVNHGPKNAFTILQMALRSMGAKITVDGIAGAETKGAASKVTSPDGLRMALIAQRLAFYSAIIKNNPSQKKFAAGWLNRAAEFVNKKVI